VREFVIEGERCAAAKGNSSFDVESASRRRNVAYGPITLRCVSKSERFVYFRNAISQLFYVINGELSIRSSVSEIIPFFLGELAFVEIIDATAANCTAQFSQRREVRESRREFYRVFLMDVL
jgi:hypothetical protein